jgi:glutaconate CoA-transferase subunit A
MLQWGLYAAALRLPFLPTRAGLGTDVMRINPHLKLVKSPYEDGEELVAMPAIHLDVALVHMNRSDERGNAQYLGPDAYFDDLYCQAAERSFVSCEQIVETSDLMKAGSRHTLRIHRGLVDGVIEAPGGAHFTECPPDYGRDEAFQREYAATAKDPEAWQAFKARYLDAENEADYHKAVAERATGAAS